MDKTYYEIMDEHSNELIKQMGRASIDKSNALVKQTDRLMQVVEQIKTKDPINRIPVLGKVYSNQQAEPSLDCLQAKKERLLQAIRELETPENKDDGHSEKFEQFQCAALACKLFTGTTMVANGNKITGSILQKDTDQLKCFQYENDDTITEKLWSRINE